MIKHRPICLLIAGLICAFSASSIYAADEKADGFVTKTGTIGISWDEGLSGKYFILDNVYAKASLFFSTAGAQDTGDEPLNTFGYKVGGGYILKDFGKLRLNAFGEFGQRLNQRQTDSIIPGPGRKHLQYNVWDTYFRIGVSPELFITDHFSIDYRLGIEFIYFGSDYKLNNAKDGLQLVDNDYSRFRTYGMGEDYKSKGVNDNAGALLAPLILHIGFNFYF